MSRVIDFALCSPRLRVRMSHNPNLRVGEDAQAPTRVRILASDTLVADALSAALSDIPGIEVVRAAEPAHVVLWDTGSEKVPAQRAQLQLQLSAAEAGAPVLALAHDETHASDLLGAGARGAVLRQASAARLAAAAVAIRYGLLVLDIELANASFGAVLPAAASEIDSGDSGLTAREREVLALLAQGLSNKTIARRLQVSIHTVKFHVNSILSKLDADSRTQAVTSAVRRGLVSL
jgi:two-component system nitrate/nitrite response regulator NarL